MERARPRVRLPDHRMAMRDAGRATEAVEAVRNAAACQAFQTQPRVLEAQDVLVPAAQLPNPPKHPHSSSWFLLVQ